MFFSIICSFLIRFSMNIISKLLLWSSWWAQVDSNHRPRAYQARALTTWAMSPRCLSQGASIRFLLPIKLNYLSFGGDEGIRTLDPLLAGQVLSQLSYTPEFYSVLFYLVPENWITNSIIQISSIPYCFLMIRFQVKILSWLTFSIERRWSSRTFRYGYLVTT